ncbi:MAG: PASTA domain protein [Candidatus Hydrogenedentes bacterium ADurb.Bin179]|nr:MAG: PASTA domain protein [Candidatus Hydrogenedentes bacterium ADurb.Bin179]
MDWSDGRTDNPRTDTDASENVSVTANFAINTYTLTYAPGENGRIVGTASQTVNHGESGTSVTAVPDPGYRFEGWSDGVATATRHDTNIVEGLAVNALFAPEPVEEKVPVPNVLLSTSEDAEDFITRAGLTLGTVTGECSDKVPQGAVITQDPAAGTQASPASPVNLVLSTGSCTSSCESFKWFGWDDVLLGGLALLALALISMFAFGGGTAVLK